MYICAYVTKTRIIWFGHALSWMLFGSSAIFALQLIYFHFIYCVLSHHVSRLKPRTTDLISDISKLKPLDVFQQVTTHFHPFPLERLLSKPTVYSATVCVSTCAASAKSRCIMQQHRARLKCQSKRIFQAKCSCVFADAVRRHAAPLFAQHMATSSLSLQFREAWRVFQHYLQKTRFSLATGPPRRTPQGWGPNLPVRSKAKCNSKQNQLTLVF